MSDFSVNTDRLRSQVDTLDALERELSQVSIKLAGMQLGSVLCIKASTSLISRVMACQVALLSQSAGLGRLAVGLEGIAELYDQTERDLSELESGTGSSQGENVGTSVLDWMIDLLGLRKLIEWINSLFLPEEGGGAYELDSVVFDDEGSYGGDQGAPQNTSGAEREVLYQQIRQYYPDMTDSELRDYLIKLDSEGCGYVAIINTIFAAYEGREAEFETAFGFPMYGSSGDLNYNLLLADFYAATDNHNRSWFGRDKIKVNEDYSNTIGRGTTPEQQKYRAELYLNERGVSVTVETGQDVTAYNYQTLAENGYVVINSYDGTLYDANGNVRAQWPGGGHSMVVTGVTEEGWFIVSSWGGQYYLDPNDSSASCNFVYYQYQ